MSIAPVSSAVGHLVARPQAPSAPAPRAATPAVATDADGDNDGSKGGSVDVRA